LNGKKSKNKKTKELEKKKSPVPWVAAVIIIIIAGLAISGNLPFLGDEVKGESFNLTERETKPVLDPAMFSGQVRSAYAAAKQYPEIMNEVFCYCFCDRPPFNHKTLLSCFTDRHGAG
jgi:hypothetical protein